MWSRSIFASWFGWVASAWCVREGAVPGSNLAGRMATRVDALTQFPVSDRSKIMFVTRGLHSKRMGVRGKPNRWTVSLFVTRGLHSKRIVLGGYSSIEICEIAAWVPNDPYVYVVFQVFVISAVQYLNLWEICGETCGRCLSEWFKVCDSVYDWVLSVWECEGLLAVRLNQDYDSCVNT